MRYLNQLEPDGLIENFIDHPPLDFTAQTLIDNTPVFSTKFDLLTTLDPDLFRRIQKLLFYKYWSEWLKPYTCFVGTTVSEYTLLPAEQLPKTWVVKLKELLSNKYSFLIIKDIPHASPLLNENENQSAAALISEAKKHGFIIVEGQALAWVPINFTSVDEYINRLSKSRRKNIRRKLKNIELLDVQVIQTGDTYFSSKSVIDEFYQLYLNVFNQSDIHFDQLSYNFLEAMLKNGNDKGVVFIYRLNNEILGYNICFVVNNKLIDKYIGFQYPLAREYDLYFISWFVNLGYALEHQLTQYVAGWTDPEVKKSLGAQFTFTHHAVFIRNPVIRNLLKPFKPLFERDHQFAETTKQEVINEK